MYYVFVNDNISYLSSKVYKLTNFTDTVRKVLNDTLLGQSVSMVLQGEEVFSESAVTVVDMTTKEKIEEVLCSYGYDYYIKSNSETMNKFYADLFGEDDIVEQIMSVGKLYRKLEVLTASDIAFKVFDTETVTDEQIAKAESIVEQFRNLYDSLLKLPVRNSNFDYTLRFREKLPSDSMLLHYALSDEKQEGRSLKELTKKMFAFQDPNIDFHTNDEVVSGIMKNFDEVVEEHNEKGTNNVTPLTAKFQIRLVGNVIKLYAKFEDYSEREIAVCDKFGKKKGTVDLLGYYPNTVGNLLDAGLIERASGHSILSEEVYQFPLDFTEKEFPVNSKTVKELTFER